MEIETEKRTLFALKTLEVIAVEGIAQEYIDRAQLNEAIRVVMELKEHVRTMPIASRFNPIRPIANLCNWDLMQGYKFLSAAEYKRMQLLVHLTKINDEITSAVIALYDVVLDIESTKQEG